MASARPSPSAARARAEKQSLLVLRSPCQAVRLPTIPAAATSDMAREQFFCAKPKDPEAIASPNPGPFFFRTESLPSLDDNWEDKWERSRVQATSSAPLRPATPRDGCAESPRHATSSGGCRFGFVDNERLDEHSQGEWVVQTSRQRWTRAETQACRHPMYGQCGSVSDSASTSWLAQGPAF